MANRNGRHRQPVTGVGVGASALGLRRLGDRVVALGEYLEHVVVGAVEVEPSTGAVGVDRADLAGPVPGWVGSVGSAFAVETLLDAVDSASETRKA